MFESRRAHHTAHVKEDPERGPPMQRGFQYDKLTEASDERVEAVRHKLFAAPCGHGTWVSVTDGTIVHGNGGNEREQWHWQKLGPWIRLDDGAVTNSIFGREREALAGERVAHARLRDNLQMLLDGDR